MNPRPLVSVIVPTYNGATFLAEAVASIRAQDYHPVEIIVVDDVSTDATATVVERLGRLVLCSHDSNRGPAAARNTGLDVARGALIAFLDADDCWSDGALTRQVDCLLETGAEIVIGRTWHLSHSAADECARDSALVPMLGSAVFLREVFERVGRFDDTLRYSEDQDWFLRAREMKVSIHVSDRVKLRYRRHPASLTQAPDRPPDLQLPRVLKRALDRRRARNHGNAPVLPPLGYPSPDSEPPS